MDAERVATYEYDGLFRRIEKTVADQGTGVLNGSDADGVTGIQAGDLSSMVRGPKALSCRSTALASPAGQ